MPYTVTRQRKMFTVGLSCFARREILEIEGEAHYTEVVSSCGLDTFIFTLCVHSIHTVVFMLWTVLLIKSIKVYHVWTLSGMQHNVCKCYTFVQFQKYLSPEQCDSSHLTLSVPQFSVNIGTQCIFAPVALRWLRPPYGSPKMWS